MFKSQPLYHVNYGWCNSAAHCFKNGTDISELFVVMGRAEPLPPPDFQDRKRRIKPIHEIESVVLHAKYNGQAAYHDLSIVRLKDSADLG